MEAKVNIDKPDTVRTAYFTIINKQDYTHKSVQNLCHKMYII